MKKSNNLISARPTKKEFVYDWEKVVKSLLLFLKKHGYLTVAASNGEEKIYCSKTKGLAEWSCQCDEGYLWVKSEALKEDGAAKETYKLFIVLGNSPSEIVADWSWPKDQDTDNFDEVLEKFSYIWELKGNSCPMKEKV